MSLTDGGFEASVNADFLSHQDAKAIKPDALLPPSQRPEVGCNCATGPGQRGSWPAWSLLAALALLVLRRRRD